MALLRSQTPRNQVRTVERGLNGIVAELQRLSNWVAQAVSILETVQERLLEGTCLEQDKQNEEHKEHNKEQENKQDK